MEKTQKIILTDRKHFAAAGVRKIAAFRETEVKLLTETGALLIRGRNLFVEKLDPEQGEVIITGHVDAMTFSGSAPEGGLLKKLLG